MERLSQIPYPASSLRTSHIQRSSPKTPDITAWARAALGKRILNAAGHLFVAHREDGTRMFNYSEWLGSASSAALGNLYHPGNQPGTGDTARRVGYGFAFDIGYDVLREFWPEITRKLRLPFRGEPDSTPEVRASPLIQEAR